MSDHGAGGGTADGVRRSRISDYAETTTPPERHAERLPEQLPGPRPEPNPDPDPASSPEQPPLTATPPPASAEASSAAPDEAAHIRRRRREAAVLLGEFRRTAVLLPLSDDGSPLTADIGGIRWIYAFSDESALARFAIARGEGTREWSYERVLGARLLDATIPAMPVPYGVALDVGPEGEGALFPPVRGIVPDAAAVDVPDTNNTDGNGEPTR